MATTVEALKALAEAFGAESTSGTTIAELILEIADAVDEGGSSGYTLPAATADTLGGIKVGTGLTIADGVLSVTNG